MTKNRKCYRKMCSVPAVGSWQAPTASRNCSAVKTACGRTQPTDRHFNIRSANFTVQHWNNPDNRWAMLLCVNRLGVKTERRCVYCAVRTEYTGLLKMIVGVLTTCHTQYTWDRSIGIFLFNRTTLQVFVTYLTGALYVHHL